MLNPDRIDADADAKWTTIGFFAERVYSVCFRKSLDTKEKRRFRPAWRENNGSGLWLCMARGNNTKRCPCSLVQVWVVLRNQIKDATEIDIGVAFFGLR